MEFMESVKAQVFGAIQGLEGEHPVLAQAVHNIVNAEGGLPGLVQGLRDKGLGDIVSSWVAKGPNLPISEQQLQQAIGNTRIAEIAQKAGLDPAIVAQKLSVLLPTVVDQLTPDGKLPAAPPS
ncbi:MAG TPA: YidB family protein [Gemmatimonadaceae bacterium]|jgi:uncharacterized protein YidB (DUF937 family)|nr:YidB family protein [Gemmatimonadaceae bacterium]